MSSTPFYAVIPAGGAGTRLWPVSRSSKPKFLLDLTGGGRTLLQSTVDRLAPLSAGVVVVTGQKHVATVREQLPQFTEQNVFAEPSPRDSMAAIGLAAAVLQRAAEPFRRHLADWPERVAHLVTVAKELTA